MYSGGLKAKEKIQCINMECDNCMHSYFLINAHINLFTIIKIHYLYM